MVDGWSNRTSAAVTGCCGADVRTSASSCRSIRPSCTSTYADTPVAAAPTKVSTASETE